MTNVALAEVRPTPSSDAARGARTLHLVRLRLDARKLFTFVTGRAFSLSWMRDLDEGYAIHALLCALFDDSARENARLSLKPFHIVTPWIKCVEPGRGAMDVIVYSPLDGDALHNRAQAFGTAAAWEVLWRVAPVASKPMPVFAAGARLGFAVRACPVRRIAKRGPLHKERVEVDAFLAKAWEVGPEVKIDRDEVYQDWLAEELAKEGAAQALEASVQSFHVGQMHRREHRGQRARRVTPRPDVTFRGALEVRDADAFARRLARGVGRHRAFGFGMLVLHPAQDAGGAP